MRAVARRLRSGADRRAASLSIIGRTGRLSYLFGRLCDKLPGVHYARHLLVAMPAGRLPVMPRGYTARTIAAEELLRYRIDADPPVQAARYAAGMDCIGAFDRHGALLGVTWVGQYFHDEPVLGVRFVLPPDAAWDGGLWIDEDRRMTRAFPALWAGVGHWLDARGLGHTISSIADYNAASIAAHRRLGARTIGRVGILRIGTLQCTIGGGSRPRLSRGRWPEIVLTV